MTLHSGTGEEEHPLSRLTTGNAQLDEILSGGFPANSINIVMGEPGSGKTIFAEHLVFANAREGDRPILYLSTLSEPLDKLVRYLQQFEFYDESKLGTAVIYDTLGPELAENGISILPARLKELITEIRPKIVVIDSFKAVHDLSTSIPEMRRMLYDIAGLLTAYETTAFLVGEYAEEDIQKFPEFAVADGVIQLAREKGTSRDERFLRILKLRGSDYLQGLHGFRLTGAGLEVFPRLVTPVLPPEYVSAGDRVPTGVAGLDKMLGGGLLPGRSTFVIGLTGAGKTTLGLQFAGEGIRRGEPCMYVGFEENPTQLSAQIRTLGMDPEEADRKGLRRLYSSPVELQIDSIVSEIFQTVRDEGIKRIVIDAVGDLLVAAGDPRRLHEYLYSMLQHFAVRGVSSLLLYEMEAPGVDARMRISAVSDNILLLGMESSDGRMTRSIRILKARGIEHDLEPHEFRITKRGMQVE